MTPQQRQTLHERCQAMIAELQADESGRTDATETVELDQTRVGRLSRMDALQGQAMAKATAQRAEQHLQRLQAVLGRIDEADFGRCRDCDEPIAQARLLANPAVLRCVACASARE